MKERKYQITLYCSTNQYKPVSCIITMKQDDDTNLLNNPTTKKEIVHKGIMKICQKRYWSKADLLKYYYTKAKARLIEEV